MLFHYFKSKRGIYLAAMGEASRGLDAAHQVDPRLPAGGQMRQLYRNHFFYLAGHEGLALRLTLSGRGTDPEAWRPVEEGRRRSLEWGLALLGLDPGNDALRMMLRAAISFADETAVQWHKLGHRFDVELIADALLDQTIAALRGAARLDPSLDVEDAITQLQKATIDSPARCSAPRPRSST